jgi:uncharacterized protein (TIGR02757 family)
VSGGAPRLNEAELEDLYACYTSREFARHDPVVFLYGYEDVADREVAALVAASLAYGRVAQILKSVGRALDAMRPSPAAFLRERKPRDIRRALSGFKHRFTTGRDLGDLLVGAKRVLGRYGSLQDAFVAGLKESSESVWPALTRFAEELRGAAGGGCDHLLPAPSRGSACKRLHLFLRWMVRRDEVDPGGWGRVPPAKLVVPLDTHMHRIGLALGLTERKSAGRAAALDITRGFRHAAPEDPVRYDFALTRLSMLAADSVEAFVSRCCIAEED